MALLVTLHQIICLLLVIVIVNVSVCLICAVFCAHFCSIYFEPESFYLKPEELEKQENGGIAIVKGTKVGNLFDQRYLSTLDIHRLLVSLNSRDDM